MRLALSGPSGVGKSWAAKQLAALLNIPYIPSKAGEVAKEIGFDVNQPFSFEELMYYQFRVLKQHKADIKDNPSGVFDRSALDMMTFLTLNLVKSGAQSSHLELVSTYMQDAIDTLFDFETIYIVSPDQETLLGTGEIKEGRLLSEIHGEDYRVRFDDLLKKFTLELDTVVTIPSNLHYMDRVNFIKERYVR